MMHYRLSVLVLAAGLTLVTAAGVFGAQEYAEPVAFFPQTDYEFSPILEGAEIMHDFVIQNKGEAPLSIERVKTD